MLVAATLLTALMGCGETPEIAAGDLPGEAHDITGDDDLGGPEFFVANRSGRAVATYESATGKRLDEIVAPKGLEIDQISSVARGGFIFSATDERRIPHFFRAGLASDGSVSLVKPLTLPYGFTPATIAMAMSWSGSKLAYFGGFGGDGSAGARLTVRDLSKSRVYEFPLARKTSSWISEISWASDEKHLVMTVLSPCGNAPPDGAACTGDVSVRVLDSTSTGLDINDAPEIARHPAWGTATQNGLASYVSGSAVLGPDGSAAYVPLSRTEKDGHRSTLVQEISSPSGELIRELALRPTVKDSILSLAMDESGRYLIARFPGSLERIRLSDGAHVTTVLNDGGISQVAW
ncbi:hypothetical protein AB0B89_31835 [Sphaerisporangium sp. NPDC049002]|uniref:hypothetical protein n=1 Tax=unclassified Sphaerisporangium TaxID=2630420 RepID=UPI0033E10618